MGLNQIKTAVRSLRRHPGTSLINGIGLTLGLACVVLIGVYLHHELTYDRFHPQSDHIAWVAGTTDDPAEPSSFTNSQGILGPTLEATLPEVKHAVRIIGSNNVFRVGETVFTEKGILYADSTFFQIFDGFRMERGSPATALDAPNSIVLTRSTAERYFGDADPLGQTIDDRGRTLTVTGVVADVPSRSHIDFDGVISLETAENPGWWYGNWFAFTFHTYVLLEKNTTLTAFQNKLPDFIQEVAGEQMEQAKETIRLRADPLHAVYLNQSGGGTGKRAQLAIFAVIAGFVLLIAGLNYVNLTTAQSVQRAREIGVRRTLGAGRAGLGAQFIAEAVVLTLLALIVALLLARLMLPAFETFTDTSLSLVQMGPWLLVLVAIGALTGVGAGFYPATILARFDPVTVLRGSFSTGSRGTRLRKGLVVVQLSISIGLIAGTMVVHDQVQFMQARDLGFGIGSPETTQLLSIDYGRDARVQERIDVLEDRMRQIPGVQGLTSSMSLPSMGRAFAGGTMQGPDGEYTDMSIEAYLTDTSFVEVMDLTLLAGNAPTRAQLSDSSYAYILNETAIRKAGFANPEDAIGAKAIFWDIDGRVVGVVKDFHTRGMQQAIEPLGIIPEKAMLSYLTLRVDARDLSSTLAEVRRVWGETIPERPFDYTFLNDSFAEFYEAEQRFEALATLFAGLAILIACLGLLGLALHSTQQRLKEISVRKVLGASTSSLVMMLSKDVVSLVAVAFVVITPVVYAVMSTWLSDFAYRTSVDWAAFVLGGVLTLTIALGTVTLQAYRAAQTDPADILQKE